MMRRQIVLWGIRNAHRVEKLIAPVQQHVGSVEDYLRAILDGRIWGDTTLIGMYDYCKLYEKHIMWNMWVYNS